jgi:DNA-directed RNA polymerase subunit M/transcription elongation factor TFIIS
MSTKQSLGGQKMAIIQRQKALEEYYKNPNICIQCNNIIYIPEDKKVSVIKRNKFCCSNCAAIYNNKKRIPKVKPKSVKVKKKIIRTGLLHTNTKEELFSKRLNYQSARSGIRRHAAITFDDSNTPKVCAICGYSLHIQIAHIKSVASFQPTSTIGEINHINNLIALCPNHHWEFDNGLLSLEQE